MSTGRQAAILASKKLLKELPSQQEMWATLLNLKKLGGDATAVLGVTAFEFRQPNAEICPMCFDKIPARPVIGALLGHVDVKTTARYAHLRAFS